MITYDWHVPPPLPSITEILRNMPVGASYLFQGPKGGLSTAAGRMAQETGDAFPVRCEGKAHRVWRVAGAAQERASEAKTKRAPVRSRVKNKSAQPILQTRRVRASKPAKGHAERSEAVARPRGRGRRG